MTPAQREPGNPAAPGRVMPAWFRAPHRAHSKTAPVESSPGAHRTDRGGIVGRDKLCSMLQGLERSASRRRMQGRT